MHRRSRNPAILGQIPSYRQSAIRVDVIGGSRFVASSVGWAGTGSDSTWPERLPRLLSESSIQGVGVRIARCCKAPPTAGRSRLCVLGHRTFHGRLQIRPSHTSLGEGPPRNSACRALLTQTHRRGAIIHSVETLAVTSVSGRHRTKNMHSHCPQLSNEQWYDFAIALYSF